MNIEVKKTYPYEGEFHIYYWSSKDDKYTFTDKRSSQGYFECDQTGRYYELNEDESLMTEAED